MVRSHYEIDKSINPSNKSHFTGDRTYRAGNALGEWFGLSGGWMDIAIAQMDDNIEEFRKVVADAK